jgi:hypothetical protein
MATFSWVHTGEGEWTVGSDWDMGVPPTPTDAASFGVLGSDYTVTVGATDNITVASLTSFYATTATTSSSFSINGSLTVGDTLFNNIGSPGPALPTDFTVNPGGFFFAQNFLNSDRAQTITIAGTGAGGRVELGGPSVGASGSNITFDFANTGPTALNTGVIQFDNVSFTGSAPFLTQRITDVAPGDEFVFPGADFTEDTVTLSGSQLAVISPTNSVVLAMGSISLEPGATNTFAIVNGNTIEEEPPPTRTWTGAAGDGKWSNPKNWEGAVPGRNDIAIINLPGPYTVTFDVPNNGNTTIGRLDIDAECHIRLRG